MTVETLRALLGWAAIFNLAFVSVWFFIFFFAHNRLLKLHRRWFDMSRQTFDAIHYAGMAGYKICTWMFIIMPYLALRFCS